MNEKTLKRDKNQSKDKLIKIVDDEGHVLFFFNPETGCVEVRGRTRGGNRSTNHKIFEINLDEISRAGRTNILAAKPIYEIKAGVIETI